MPITDAHALRRRRLTYLGVYVALAMAFCWPILVRPLANGTGDWDQHLFYYAAPLRNAAYGSLPFWNPWYCGGNVLWQNPQVSLISPVYLLALAMPLALAMKLNVVAHFIAGFLGMHLILRRIVGVQSPVVVVYLASLFVLSGAMALHLAAGHSVYLPGFYLPALVYCFYRAAAGETRSVLLGGAIVGAAVLNGGTHVAPLAGVLLGSLALGAMIVGRTFKPMVLAVVIVLAGCAYAAPKLVPAVLFTQSVDFHDRRGVKTPDFMSADMLRRALSDSSQDTSTKMSPGVQLYAWHEYGNYLGWFGAVLILAGAGWILVFRTRREHWREGSAAVGVVLVLLLTAGEFATWAPASLMRNVPIVSSFRIPSRYILLLPIVGAICLAYAARAIEARRSPATRRLLPVLGLVGLLQLGLVNREHLRDVFILPPTTTETLRIPKMTPVVAAEEPSEIEWTRLGESSKFLRVMEAGVSQLNCYEPLLVKRIAKPGLTGLVGDDGVTLAEQTFSPNRMAAHVAVGRESVRVILNQNFADGWSTNLGPVERDPESGRPSIVAPAGYTGTIAFIFLPPGLWLGLAIWVLAIGISIGVWRRG